MSVPGLTEDLERVVSLARDDILKFRDTRIFLTGGTGFVGTWLLASIAYANARLGARISVDVITRNPDAFAAREPTLSAADGVKLLQCDLRRPLKVDATFDAVIAAATPTAAEVRANGARATFEAMLDGHRATLDIAARNGAVPFLFTSSGAVYGPQPDELDCIGEDFAGAPNQLEPESAYAEGKRACEFLSSSASARGGPLAKIARMFAFVGPNLPIDQHFAIGNFIRDALAGGPIVVRGDGRAVRSYLYAADMAVWLWAIFARGATARAYNVGSEHEIEIRELAHVVVREAPKPMEVLVKDSATTGQSTRYVPSTKRTRKELGVRQTLGLDAAVGRTLRWHESRGQVANARPS